MPRKKKEPVELKPESLPVTTKSDERVYATGETLEEWKDSEGMDLKSKIGELNSSHNELWELVSNIQHTVAKTILLDSPSDSSPNIFQRMISVMKEVNYIRKGDKKVNNQYTYVSHDQVTGRLHIPCANNGIVVISTMDSHDIQNNMTICTVTTKFVNADNPDDHTSATSVGYGIDRGDKGAGKAMSYAIKYNLLKAFMLETGDDPDHDQHVVKEPTNNGTPSTSKKEINKSNKLSEITKHLQSFSPKEKLLAEKDRLVQMIFENQSDLPNSASSDEALEHIDRLNKQKISEWSGSVVDKIYEFITKE